MVDPSHRCLSPVEPIPLIEAKKQHKGQPREIQTYAPSLSEPVSAATWLPELPDRQSHQQRSPFHSPRWLPPISTKATQHTAHILVAFKSGGPMCVFEIQIPGSALMNRKLGNEELHQSWQAVASGIVLRIDLPLDLPMVHKFLCFKTTRDSDSCDDTLLVSALLGPRPPQITEDEEGVERAESGDGSGSTDRWFQWHLQHVGNGGSSQHNMLPSHDQSPPDGPLMWSHRPLGSSLGSDIACLEDGGQEGASASRAGCPGHVFLAGTTRGTLQLWGLRDDRCVDAGGISSITDDGSPRLIRPALLHEYDDQFTPSASPLDAVEAKGGKAPGYGATGIVARHPPSGFVAAAVARGQMGRGSRGAVVHIWRPSVGLRKRQCAVEGRGTNVELENDGGDLVLDSVLEMEAVMELEARVDGLAWVTGAGIIPVLALALESGKAGTSENATQILYTLRTYSQGAPSIAPCPPLSTLFLFPNLPECSGLVCVYIRDRATGDWTKVAAHRTGPSSLRQGPLSLAGLSNGTLAVATGKALHGGTEQGLWA